MVKARQRIIKTGIPCDIGSQTNSQFIIPFRSSNKIFGCKWINRYRSKSDRRSIDVYQSGKVILTVITIYGQIIFPI